MRNKLCRIIRFFALVILATSVTIITNLFSNNLSSICTDKKTDILSYYCVLTELSQAWSLVILLIIVFISVVYEFWFHYINPVSRSSEKKQDILQRLREGFGLPVYQFSENFKGRKQALEKLHHSLNKNNRLAILGIPGVGKTELAKQYVINKKYRERYHGFIWLDGNYLNSIRRAIQSICSPESRLPHKLTARDYWAKLPKTSQPILVIFDGCYNFEELNQYLPSQSYFKVLITSPLSRSSSYINKDHTLQPLSEEAAIALFKCHLEPILPGEVDKHIELVKHLCKELGYLPLAIEEVSSYIRHPDEFERLLKLFQADSGKFFNNEDLSTLDINQDNDREIKTILSKTLDSYDQLWPDLPEEEKILACCLSFFAATTIPPSFIDEFAEVISNLINKGYPTRIKYAAKELRNRYLGNSPKIVLHPILRIFFKFKRKEFVNQLDNAERLDNSAREFFCNIMAIFAGYIPQETNRHHIPFMEDSIIPHIEVAVTLILNNPESKTWFNKTEEDDDEAVTLLAPFMGLIKFYRRIGQSGEAIKWQEKCKEFVINIFGYTHPLYTRCLNNLACLYDEEDYYKRALESAKINLGENHKLTALIRRNLGNFYRKTQKAERGYQQAKEQLQEAVIIYGSYATSSKKYYRKQILSECDLAQVQCRLRNFEAAERFYSSSELQSFQEELKSSGTKDQIAYSRIEYDIAEFYRLRAQLNYDTNGNINNAAQHCYEALEIREKYLKDDSHVADSLIQLARIYQMQNQLQEAARYYVRALQIYQKDPPTSDESWSNLKNEYDELLRKQRQKALLQ